MTPVSDPLLLGIDLGTQALRGAVFTVDGSCLAAAHSSYDTQVGEAGRVEQDPTDWFAALMDVLGQLRVRAPELLERVVGLSVAATSCTVVISDRDGKPLRPALLWMDERAREQAARYTATASPFLRYAGGTLSPQWMLPKALWVAEEEPETYRAADVIAEAVDWLTYRLTGRWVCSQDNLASKWNYVTELGGYPDDLLDQIGPSDLRGRWPSEIGRVGTPVGTLTTTAAEQLGLRGDCIVATGGIDAHAAAVAMGALADGVLACSLGTSNCMIANTPEARFNRIWGPFPEALRPGTYTLVGGQTAAGATLDWLGGVLGVASEDGEHRRASLVNGLASSVEPASHGIVFLDHLQGNRMPYMDPRASGTIWGLRVDHTAGHVARAVIDGMAIGTRLVIDEMARGFKPFSPIRAAGGLTRSEPYLTAVATALGQPIEVMAGDATAARGAAVWAALGAGVTDVAASAASAAADSRWVEPGAHRERYDELLDRYERTYEALAPLMHDVREV